MIPAFHQ